MLSQILKYDIVGNVATGGAEVTPSPEMPPPVTFTQGRKLHLHAVRRPAFDPPYEVADCDMGRDFHEHMHVFFGQDAGHNLNAELFANLPDNRAYPLP